MKIKTYEINLESFFSGLSTRYQVPNYQRDYSWGADEIDQLWVDLIAAFATDSDYFAGTIVLNEEINGHARIEGALDIVDGQQRLATLSIIFCIIRNIGKQCQADTTYLSNFARDEIFQNTVGRIFTLAEDRLLHRSEPDNYFLRLNAKDNSIFFQQIQTFVPPRLGNDDLRLIKSESRLLKAKKILTRHVRNTFLAESTDIRQLYRFLVFLCKRLQFIQITVETDYDAYLLFESLNSKGLDLSTADLVKNKLLAICRADDEKRSRVLSTWNEIVTQLLESRFSNPVEFLRFYWIAFGANRPTKRDLYKVVRAKLQEPEFDPERFTRDLLESVEHFVFLTHSARTWPSSEIPRGGLDQYVSEMNALRYAIHIPVFLYAMKYRSQDFLVVFSKKSLSFLFRLMTIGDFAVGVADATFTKILDKLRQTSPRFSDQEILECFDAESEKIGDESFKSAFNTFTSENNQVCRYILSKIHIHEYGNEQIPKADEFHLEHVLPQNSTLWEENGFDFCGDSPDSLKYCLGNMTLLNKSLNSAISNRVFQEKVNSYQKRNANIQNGTTFPMTYEIYNRYVQLGEDWTVETIRRRCAQFAEVAPRVWPR